MGHRPTALGYERWGGRIRAHAEDANYPCCPALALAASLEEPRRVEVRVSDWGVYRKFAVPRAVRS